MGNSLQPPHGRTTLSLAMDHGLGRRRHPIGE
jgi:hypothetical protein